MDEGCRDQALGSRPPVAPELPGEASHVSPGTSIQDVAEAAGPGATIVIGRGIHRRQEVVPLQGQAFLGERGAVLRGEGARFAFRSSARDVVIEGLVIEQYRPEPRDAVIHGDPGASGWMVRGNEIRNNEEKGIKAVSQWTVEGNAVHHNGRYGITGAGGELVVRKNEIACNALDYGPTGDSGATKFVHTRGLRVSENHVHHNEGNGLWIDIDNRDFVVAENRVEDNLLSGIFIEISCDGTVRSNLLSGNARGADRPRNVLHSAIFVSTSSGIEVTNNRLVDNAKGIGGLHWDHGNREAVEFCDPSLRELYVHENMIRQESGIVAGIDASTDRNSVWSEWGNRFARNVYHLGEGVAFKWQEGEVGPGTWLESVEGG